MGALAAVDEETGPLQDYKKAVYWSEKSIQSNKYDANSLLGLGNIYYFGKPGFTQNKIKSYKYWKECASVDESRLLAEGLPLGIITRCQNNLDILCTQSPWACQK